MEFEHSIKLPIIYGIAILFEWLIINVGIEGQEWNWDFYCSSYNRDEYDIFYFKCEEDKVKFILKWL